MTPDWLRHSAPAVVVERYTVYLLNGGHLWIDGLVRADYPPGKAGLTAWQNEVARVAALARETP